MNGDVPFRVVLDTNVIFEGLTQRNGACGLIIDAWQAGLIRVCVSDALTYEYVDVLSRKLSAKKWHTALMALNTLLEKAEFVSIYYTWRPVSPDPGDDFVVDCVMNANALLVTSNRKDFRLAETELGLQVASPVAMVLLLAQ